jgi:hypothetical protein
LVIVLKVRASPVMRFSNLVMMPSGRSVRSVS